MKKFMAVFIGTASSPAMAQWNSLDEKTRSKKEEEGKTAWMNWAVKNAKSITDNGAPLGKTKRINIQGISDIKNNLTAYVVVEAESHEAAAKIFLEHPHFSIFPGDSVEIMECLPMPT